MMNSAPKKDNELLTKKGDPFINKRQSLPPVSRAAIEEFNLAGGLINGGGLPAGPFAKMPSFIPKNLLADPYNQLNSPHSLRATRMKG